jgi:hypothetical protein
MNDDAIALAIRGCTHDIAMRISNDISRQLLYSFALPIHAKTCWIANLGRESAMMQSWIDFSVFQGDGHET